MRSTSDRHMPKPYARDITVPLTVQIEDKGDYWTGSVKGIGVLVYAETYDGAIDRTIKAFNFLLSGLLNDGADLEQYFADHGIDCEASHPNVTSMPSAWAVRSQHPGPFFLSGSQAIPIRGKVRVPG